METSTPPPPYTAVAANTDVAANASLPQSTTTTSVPRPLTTARPTPSITLLFLGSPHVGKSTFLSQIANVRNGGLQPPPISVPSANSTTSMSQPIAPVPNPTSFSVSLFARPYKITIHRSTSTLFIDPFPPKIDALVLCYAIDDRTSLFNVQKYWRRVFAEKYEQELGVEVPILLLGLKRDLRTEQRRPIPDAQGFQADDASLRADGEEQDYSRAYGQRQAWKDAFQSGSNGQEETSGTNSEYVCVMPQEAVRIANELRCDRYAECSALTGDLMWEALEDITRMAAKTTTNKGGFSDGPGCVVM